ncbi:MAG: hypothetical protein ABMB14_37375 [Myxococcota bacterium]
MLMSILFADPAFAKEYKLNQTLNQVTAGETLTVSAEFVEPQNDHYVARMVFTSASKDRAIGFDRDAIQCWRGATAGKVQYTNFGIGERHLDLQPGETKILMLSCLTGAATGDFKLNLREVNDLVAGTPGGPVLFADVTWTLAESTIDKKSQKVIPPGFVPRKTDHPVPPPASAPPVEAPGIVAETAAVVGEVAGTIAEEVEEHTSDDPPPPATVQPK